jgi:NodT family efflux transporter outer membrane factor (OMF) lipoprotein
MRPAAALLALLGAGVLAGCASPRTPLPAERPLPAAWQAPRPDAAAAADLSRWWQQFDDPLVAALIERAQAASPTVAAARSRIEQARAARVGAGAALAPGIDASAQASRGRPDLASPIGNSASIGVQAGWEIDLFGGGAAGRDAAQARLDGARAGWHDARIAVAAETASAYLAYRACEAQLAVTERDAASRAETARLTGLAAQAGFQPPANAALARASAAQGSAAVTQQRAACASLVKGLVAITAGDEPALRDELTGAAGRLPQPAQLALDAVPARALAQRPDLLAAERELLAAAAEVDQARAQRLPRITLAGSIGQARFSSAGFTQDGTVWSLGPLAVTLPVFDAGRRAAQVDAATARLDEAASAYRARLRGAVREVEDALLALQSSAARGDDARLAAEGFDASYRATESRHRGGLASLFELEDARRSALAAQSALIELQRERVAAWISLYRAVGGGWTDPDLAAPTTQARTN